MGPRYVVGCRSHENREIVRSNRKVLCTAAIGALLLASAALVVCQSVVAESVARSYPDSTPLARMIEIQRRLYNDEFRTADSVASLMITEHPQDPAGHLFRAIVRLTVMFDEEEESGSDRFHHSLDSAHLAATKVRDTSTSNKTQAWMSLFLGHVEAYRALWETRFGSRFSALQSGRDAKREYQRGLAYDSSLYDLYFGLGLFNYYKSAKAGILRWIGLIHNDTEKGIRQLYLAAESSAVSKEAARSALIWIYSDKEAYDSVIVLSRRMLQQYPDGKTFLWPLAQACYEKKDYDGAASAYTTLRNRVSVRPGNYFNLIECDYYLYRCYQALEKNDLAHGAAQRLQTYEAQIPQETRRRQRSKIAYLKRMWPQ
ncbi:MAG TPA: hypothetical protein VN285_11395 [Candidatus Deferrimicrobium sp.]|nr:hypothetical protein [Candidatus Deferrimicrobium sp.]